MVANRHTCCLCREPRHPVEKHHINGDPSDNDWDNLAVLCRNCHGLVTGKANLGSNYTRGEVLQYKQDWERRCAQAADEAIDSPVEAVHETKQIDANEHEQYQFDMEQADELVFSIDAEDCLDAVICDEKDIEAWLEGGADEEQPLPDNYWCRTGVLEGEYTFVAREAGCYVLLLINWEEEPTQVTVDAAVWGAEA